MDTPNHTTTRPTLRSPLSLAMIFQALLLLCFVIYFKSTSSGMRPIMQELFQKPIALLGISFAALVVALVLFLRVGNRLSCGVVLIWATYDIVSRCILFDAHIGTDDHPRHVWFGGGIKAYFVVGGVITLVALILALRRFRALSER